MLYVLYVKGLSYDFKPFLDRRTDIAAYRGAKQSEGMSYASLGHRKVVCIRLLTQEMRKLKA